MISKRYLNIIALVCVILNITCSSIIIINPNDNNQNANNASLIVNSQENVQDIMNTDTNVKISSGFPKAEKYFPFGTNINWGWIEGLASRQGLTEVEWVEAALEDMQAHHINTIHFNNLYYDDPGGINLNLFNTLARERGIRLYPQSGGPPYYFPRWLPTKEERDEYFEILAKPAYANLINQYIDSEGILVWGIIEEPSAWAIPELKTWTEYIDGLDPNHPCVVLYQSFETVDMACDIIKPRIIPFDIYPFFTNPIHGPVDPPAQLSYYESRIYDRYKRAYDCGAPLWVLAQGMKLYYGPDGDWRFRYPTPNEMHWEAWDAIVNGAKGIIYWTYTSSPSDNPGGETIFGLVDRDGNPTEIWNAINDVWSGLEPFTRIIVDIDESESSIISNMGEGIRARTFQRSTETERYIIVVNTDVENNKSTNLELTGTENIYDLTTLKQITSDQLFNHVLLPGRGNIYLVGTEDDFNNYLDKYVKDNVNRYDDKHPDSINIIELFTNYRFLLLFITGIISLVIIVISRRFTSKHHNRHKRHKHYPYKY